MNLIIHRGSKEIGGSCVEVESQGQRLLLDLGLPLDAEGDPRQFLPEISGLDGRDPSLLGILISHPHQDHWGLLAQVAPTIKTGMGAAARRILTAAAPFMRDKYTLPAMGWTFESEKPLQIGSFTVTPYLVDHSAYDSYALLIEADGKRVFYSGDFRAHGAKHRLFDAMVKAPPEGIDVLILEGTAIGRTEYDETIQPEEALRTKFKNTFAATKGLVLAQLSAQNIDRVCSIMSACNAARRTMVIDLYAAAILEATGNLKKIPQSNWDGVVLFIPKIQEGQIERDTRYGLKDLLTKHSTRRIYLEDIRQNPKKYVMLFRPTYIDDLEAGNCLNGASYIYSQWEGYWERDCFKTMRAFIEKHKIPKTEIHTSGHASPADLQKFVTALNPQKVVPIHSFEPERYKELFENVEIHKDGEPWTVG
jgi:ribonuclease J